MPIALPPISRRRFLSGSAAAGASLLLGPHAWGADSRRTDPHRLALLSDIHIAADRTAHERGVVMTENFLHARREVLALDPQPVAAFINGDCAYHFGHVEDYRTLLEELHPLREAGFPLYLSMGNHDRRDHLWQTLPDSERHVNGLPDRQVAIVKFPRANFFLLDSLDKTNSTPGTLGEPQLHWLARALDAHTEKPAVVMVHHQPDEREHPEGLTDTRELLHVLLPRRNVKALFYGHTHHWNVGARSGMHCVNLPAVAYVFQPGDPSGWVDAHLHENGMSLELRCIDREHPAHADKVNLTWRS